jgi:hypothetical protein
MNFSRRSLHDVAWCFIVDMVETARDYVFKNAGVNEDAAQVEVYLEPTAAVVVNLIAQHFAHAGLPCVTHEMALAAIRLKTGWKKRLRELCGYEDPAPSKALDWKGELWNADPSCAHNVVDAPGGGVRCTKCSGWLCY